jgi:hypothetical protein
MNEKEYSSHQEQVAECQPSPERIKKLEDSLIEAYEKVITYQEVPFIVFGDLNAEELAAAFVKYPIIIKPTLCCVNVAQRAVKRDLGFDLNTYSDKISETHAALLAGYIKPLLPPAIAVPALMELDRFFWTDKEMRARKGNWEKTVTLSINKASSQRFKKTYPQSRFIAVVNYPFPNQHLNLQNRLQSKDIEGVFFAGETESSIANVADMLVGTLGLKESNE